MQFYRRQFQYQRKSLFFIFILFYLPQIKMEPESKVANKPHEKEVIPFRISNRAFDSKDRFLTYNSKLNQKENKHLAEFSQSEHIQDSTLWVIEPEKQGEAYRIKNKGYNKYLTLFKSSILIDKKDKKDKQEKQYKYLAYFTDLDEQSTYQKWYFNLAANRRSNIFNKQTIPNADNKGSKVITLYLQYSPDSEEGYTNVLRCQFQAPDNENRSYLQNWKFSPKAQKIPRQCINDSTGFFKEFDQDIRTELKDLLKGFKGDIFYKDTLGYTQHIHDYASTSYTDVDRCPFMLVFPQNYEEIKIIIKVARLLRKKLITRSGGHQYSGLSSGGSNTIVLSMAAFYSYKYDKATNRIEVEPCVPLKVASKKFRDDRISVPHGMCPQVNIGGHGQTGGYGNYTRTFGILVDYIQAFDIILANGSEKKVTRPTSANTEQERFNLRLFRGVLSGNAGSFGIVTKYYLKGIKDSDHPRAYAKRRVRYYTKQLFQLAIEQFKRWTTLMNTQSQEEIEGLDLFFSLTSAKIDNRYQPIICLTGLNSSPKKGVSDKNNCPFQKLFQIFTRERNKQQIVFQNHVGFCLIDPKLQSEKIPKSLSGLAQNFVGRYPMMTNSGRQFDLPYQRRGNVTTGILTSDFITRFVDQAHNIITSQPDLKLVIQMVAGGSGYKDKGEKKVGGLTVTGMPLRNMTHTFTYDIFYSDEEDKIKEAKSKAVARQAKMQDIVEGYYNVGGEKSFFWTTYGDLDIRKYNVINKFYDSPEQYKVLQELKKEVDPEDIFSTKMTVKLPSK